MVDYAVKHGTRPTARFFNISEGTIRSWKLRGFDKHTPVVTRGRKVTYGQDLDDELHLGLMALISERQIITVDQFTEYARKIIDERRPELNFKCSRGWIDKFLNRHNLAVIRSETHKVMHIVEKEELELLRRPSSVAGSYAGVVDAASLEAGVNEREGSPDATDTAGGGVGVDRGRFVVGTQQQHDNSSSSETPPTTTPTNAQHDDSWGSGNGGGGGGGGGNGQNGDASSVLSPPPKKYSKTAAGYNSYLEGGVVNRSLSEREQRKQKEMAKSMHVMDIVEKLDDISNSAAGGPGPLDPQTRAEVVRYAKEHGSRNAERRYGVPETTVKFWVKKASLASNMAAGQQKAAACGSSTNHHHQHHYQQQQHGHHSPGHTPSHTPGHAPSHVAMQVIPASRPGGQPRGIGGGGVGVGGEGGGTSVSRTAGEIEAKILAWALERRLRGETVTFDSLCDQALSFVSQENPGSAYSSTRKWVDQFLNLRLKDVLTVQN